MRFYEGGLLHSASDLNAFLGCAHATALDMRKLLNPESLPEKAKDDESMVLIADAGHAHEASYLASLSASGPVIEIPSSGSLSERAAATTAAMHQGVPVIYQAAFLQTPWHGFSDFLIRVETPSRLGAFSYETVDTKLSRTPRPKHVLQLALYSELIAGVQGATPTAMRLMLGDGKEAIFRSIEFRYTLEAAKSRYLDFVGRGAQASRPEPCSTCQLCGWRDVCGDQWEAEDHLSRVAGIQKSQIRKLAANEINSMAALAAVAIDAHIPKLAPITLARLRAQAELQVARKTGDPVVESLPLEIGRGFARLPAPDAYDLFFDLEGDPLHPDGLEYLWGVHYRNDDKSTQFRFMWGHDRAAERAAFEGMVDWFTQHLAAYPSAHIYHYAPYEVTVLRRLSTAFATREESVDRLLRAEKFVDLYAVAKGAIRTSEPNLSLKTLEIFFAEQREGDVKKADQSIVHYHRWKETGDQSILDGILEYNRIDCQNTEGLRDWLLELRPEIPWWSKPGPAPEPEKAEHAIAEEARRELLRQAIRRNAVRLSDRGRELVAHLLDFHGRAKKPEQWAIFDRCSRDPDELIDDGECIGDISPAGHNWQRVDKRSVIATYRFPEQDSKLREGKDVLHSPTMEKLGSVFQVDYEAGVVEVRRGGKLGSPPWPEAGSIIPAWPLDTGVLELAVERVAAFLADDNREAAFPDNTDVASDHSVGRYQAIVDIVERSPPRMFDWPGGDLVQPGESLIGATTARALSLNNSALFIQGPPGTGKTYTSAHVILALIAAGKKIGVSSNSHKAINNLLSKVEQIAIQTGQGFSGVKKVTRGDTDTYLNGRVIVDIEDSKGIEVSKFDLIGGTAWLFARPELDQKLDYLFIDEAGQLSLGHLVAMGAAARNIILVGDQMQLGQPIQGAHPGESGLSTLDYLLQGAATIASDRGILLDTSWRMHPSILGFISSAVYDGRLKAHPDCARQTLRLDPGALAVLPPHGIRMIAMNHEGCAQISMEEVDHAAAVFNLLQGQQYIDRQGVTSVIGLENILVVAPYNLQVNALKTRLPAGARVGTVDKFQGQEAEVVIVSLATSSPDDLPRHVDFFYSKNRLNVAISRARTLAVVLASPKLLELDAKSVEHLRLVNTLAWLTAHARSSPEI